MDSQKRRADDLRSIEERSKRTKVSSDFETSRVKNLNNKKCGSDGVIAYWMSRDQRVHDNWALLYAQSIGKEKNLPVVVVFCLVPSFLGATYRHFMFMLKGLQELEQKLQNEYKIPFIVVRGNPGEEIPKFVESYNVAQLITDFSPLRISREWKDTVAKTIDISLCEVDAHNVVPAWVVSTKQEWAARTIRSKVHSLLPKYLVEFPALETNNCSIKLEKVDWEDIFAKLKDTADTSVPEITWAQPGEIAAKKHLDNFLAAKFKTYADNRNDPNLDGQSNLSPYLHYGQISAQRIVLEAAQYRSKLSKSYDAFVEELVVRRELADNFCFYNPNYDNFKGFPDWARQTLQDHAKDKRDFIYTTEQFEQGKTHDKLWNAAQLEMVKMGKMHGFMRMYWAKKILEWTSSAEEAMKIAVHLNDKYEIDGRDPNGYVGCAWSVGGVHDQGWKERKVFGKIRYMNYEGCRRKFNVDNYISRVAKISVPKL